MQICNRFQVLDTNLGSIDVWVESEINRNAITADIDCDNIDNDLQLATKYLLCKIG